MQWSLGKPLPRVRHTDGQIYDNFVTEGWVEARSGGRMHQSFDMRAPVGTPTYATAPGTVVYAGQYNDGSGGAVEIDHGDFATRHLHLSRIDVKKGDRVAQGKQLGATGFATSAHLHIDMWALPSVVSSYIAKFGRPLGLGQTKAFSSKVMTKLPLEPVLPASYQKDVVDGAKKAGVPLYSPLRNPVVVVGVLGLIGAVAYWYFSRRSIDVRPALSP